MSFFLKISLLLTLSNAYLKMPATPFTFLIKMGTLTVNRKAEESTGFRGEDFVGKSFRKIIPIRSLSNAIKGFLDVIRGKEIRLESELKTATKKTAKRRSQSSFKLVSRNWKKRKLPKRHGARSSLPHFHIFT